VYCNNSNDFMKNSIPKTEKAYMAVMTPSSDDDFMVRKITLESGGSMPNHTNEIQHQQYVLSGEAKVVVGDEIYRAKEGDFLYIPAGVNHYYEAIYGMDYVFLCMIPDRDDKIVMLEK